MFPTKKKQREDELDILEEGQTTDKQTFQNFNKSWGWYELTYELSGKNIMKIEDILRMEAIFILNHLSFIKEKENILKISQEGMKNKKIR